MRPWVLRALIMTLLHGVAQTLFVYLASRFAGLSLLWTLLLLGTVVLVGLFWAGAEVVADRIPEEWTWTKASLAAAPGAGLLSWVLLTTLVDASGVAELGPSLVGRASFTFLVVLGSTALGARLGWLALGRQGDARADQDPGADVDEPSDEVPDGASAPMASALTGSAAPPVLPADTTDRVAERRARRQREREPVAEAAPTGRGTPDTRVPFGAGPFAERPTTASPAASTPAPSAPAPGARRGEDGYASPVVAVLPPVTPLPSGVRRPAGTTPTEGGPDTGPDDDEATGTPRAQGSRRRFGLRRPDDD